MQVSYDTFYTNIFPTYTLQQLIQYKKDFNEYVTQNREKMDLDDFNDNISFEYHLEGAIVSKRNKLYDLTDTELNNLAADNSIQQRYLRRCEDVILESCEDNKRGFYDQWDQLREEQEGIWFEVSRRKFFEERSNR